MGLMNKLKNILFEEEEIEIPVIEKKEKVVEKEPVFKEGPKVEEKKVDYDSFYDDFVAPEVVNPVREVPKKEEVQPKEVVSERELFNSQRTFNFPAFDEEEFESAVPKPRPTNVLEYERSKQEKRYEYNRVEKKEEVRETKTKFRPSPIISPVYGILDKNYTPDEIQSREVVNRSLDVDSVRKKAFGALENKKIEKKEPVVVENDILEEKWEKARTIDELLKDSSDEVISLEEEILGAEDGIDELDKLTLKDESSFDNLELKPKEKVEEDTLESDLFDLIDSMYENREDGE